MLLIDVYNILHLPAAAALDVQSLCGLLGQSRYAGQRLVALCDGYPPATLRKNHPSVQKTDPNEQDTPLPILMKLRGVEVCFVGSERTADDEIERLLRKHRGQRIIVVSTDRRLRRAAKRAGGTSIISQTFLHRILADQEKLSRAKHPAYTRDIPLDPYSVAHWLDVFGLKNDSRVSPQKTAPAQIPPKKPNQISPASAVPTNRSQSPQPKKTTPPLTILPKIPNNKTDQPNALEHLADDPIIRAALTEWAGRMNLDELDMARWLQSHPPKAKRKPRPQSR